MSIILKMKVLIFVPLMFTICVLSLQIIPERSEVYFTNAEYIKDVVLNVRKLGRRGAKVVNLNFTLIYEVGNNVTMDLLFYEYLHNEYKRTFVEMHFNICDMFKEDLFVGVAVKNAGITTCPLIPDTYTLKNLIISNLDNFPYVWPFERAKVIGVFMNHKTGAIVANGSIFFTFKQKAKKP